MTTRTSGVIAPESSGISACLDSLVTRKSYLVPVSTYRMQFNAQFRFEDAIQLIDYIDALGITHCYASPILKARAGSMHGYDITDHNAINPEIGNEQQLEELTARLKEHKMGLILDTVPNHMGVGYGDNLWWQDILENGRASRYASFFDIDWQPVKTELRDKVLIPILGDQYGTELEAGHLKLRYEEGRFLLHYYDKPLPIDPQTIPIIFEPLGDLRAPRVGVPLQDDERMALENILWDFRQLPSHTTSEPGAIEQRLERGLELRNRLRQLTGQFPRVRELIEAAVGLCNGQEGDPRSFDSLHRVLEAQAYRLSHWRVSAQEINYRRFFDINDLVGLRMENAQVFLATHKLLRQLLAAGIVSGIRLDHPDGLLNPTQYFTRLQMLYTASQCCGPEPILPVAENGVEIDVQEIFGQHDWREQKPPLYLLVEKILEPGEEMPREWPVDGTVGYDFANLVNGIFIDQRNARFFTNLYRRFIGGDVDVNALTYEAKKLIMRTSLSSEVTVLSHLLEEIASKDRHARDFTRPALTDAIREAIACFPVYRTYVDERGNVIERDRTYINEAILRAKRRNPGTVTALFDFLKDILLLNLPAGMGDTDYRARLHFTLKFQQLTGPVMAKGMEDTVFYVYNRFVALNEVGGSPGNFGIPVEEFHRGNLERAEHWPNSMVATSTHDTKRSEDVRARLDVLSEMPRPWAAQVMRWRRWNRPKKRPISDGRIVPDPNEEYLLYQTLVGAWPLDMTSQEQRANFASRIKTYMSKALHEAKVNLSWVNQNPEYAKSMDEFIDRILRAGTSRRLNQFLQQIETFVPTVAFFGAINSVAQTLLKITAPGVPDIYQGTELWDFSLVDPDNRRPVDYGLRRNLLRELEKYLADESSWPSLCKELVSHFHDGRIKLWTTLRALHSRRGDTGLFRHGRYLPLTASGEAREHVVAFARVNEQKVAITVVPRLPYTLMNGQVGAPFGEVWRDTYISVPRPSAEYRNAFTGQVLAASPEGTLLCREVFAHFPAALLFCR